MPMTIKVATNGSITGTFYDHPIALGHAGNTRGEPCFAFRTADPSGRYLTTGCLVGDHLQGQTWSEGRHFILPWVATRP